MSPQGQRSLNVFDLIDSICKEFRADWKAGGPPRIEDYLGKFQHLQSTWDGLSNSFLSNCLTFVTERIEGS